MAAIDKIYVNSYDEFKIFWNWCDKYQVQCFKETEMFLMDIFYIEYNDEHKSGGYYSNSMPIANTGKVIDRFLYIHCPISFVRAHVNYIEEIYGHRIKKKIKIYA